MQDYVIAKMFGTGQVTIPKKYRENVKAKEFMVTFKNGSIIMTPFEIFDENEEGWEVLFNANRDGGPITGKKLLEAIKAKFEKNGSDKKSSKKSSQKR